MHSKSFAQIVVRALSIYLLWRALEQLAVGWGSLSLQSVMFPKDELMAEMMGSIRLALIGSALIPVVMSAVLWALAPKFANWMTPEKELTPERVNPRKIQRLMIQVAGIVFVGWAMTLLPNLIRGLLALKEQGMDAATSMGYSNGELIRFFSAMAVGMVLMVRADGFSRKFNRQAQIEEANH